ncbi:MAG: M23 family metallopeptidase [Acidobacteria bacterium]|nr:M23 family metallopeptidase [Acidobacteriota bacterium]
MIETNYRSGFLIKAILVGLVILILALAGQGFFLVGGPPDIHIKPAIPTIGNKTPVTIEIAEPRRGLVHARVELVQGNKAVTVIDKSYPSGSQFFLWDSKTEKDVLKTDVGRGIMPGLAGGDAIIRVTADRATTWLRHPKPAVEEVRLPVNFIPPVLQITSTQTYAAQGGCEAVTYRVGESAVRDGVRAGAWWFPGYPLPGGGKQDRFALFAVPYDMARLDVRLVVEDAAGNKAERGFIDQYFAKSFKSDDMGITDAFLNKVVPEIMAQTPDLTDRGNLLDNYVAINRELRQKNAERIKALAQKSKPEFLWNSPFFMMPNGKVMAGFADRRTYLYQGREIDRQTHLGFDLAVTKQAPIPAANSGIVVYAGYLGIYGNAVVIDHGYGLQSIYGHLSSVAVKEGQNVTRAEIIGKTGETGLAGGDHLHFCTLLQGLPVNPREWWDGHWILDRIAKKLGSAFPYESQ